MPDVKNKHLDRPDHLFARRWILVLVLALSSCALPLGSAFHGFQFDVKWDSPGVVLLDYRYGDSGLTATKPSSLRNARGEIAQYGSIFGDFPVGETLYVKWKLEETGDVFEDAVSLRGRLPPNMNNHRIYFRINKRTLEVFVVSPELRDKDEKSDLDSLRYRAYRVKRIYANAHQGPGADDERRKPR